MAFSFRSLYLVWIGLLLLIGSILTAYLLYYVNQHDPQQITKPQTTSASVNSTKAPTTATPTDTPPQSPSVEPLRFAADKPIPELFTGEKERDLLQKLAAQYDAKLIPQIATYLKDKTPEVRAAAVDALVQVGDAAAIPYLTYALNGLVPESEEAEHLNQAISFLRLPTVGL